MLREASHRICACLSIYWSSSVVCNNKVHILESFLDCDCENVIMCASRVFNVGINNFKIWSGATLKRVYRHMSESLEGSDHVLRPSNKTDIYLRSSLAFY